MIDQWWLPFLLLFQNTSGMIPGALVTSTRFRLVYERHDNHKWKKYAFFDQLMYNNVGLFIIQVVHQYLCVAFPLLEIGETTKRNYD